MARPRKDPMEKSIKQSVSIKADVLPVLMERCNQEDRAMSWIIDKALRQYLGMQGNKWCSPFILLSFGRNITQDNVSIVD